MMHRKQFARLVNANRALLIKRFSYLFPGSSVQAIEALTVHAIAAGYIKSRNPPPGATLKEWVSKNAAPQWACRAAFDLILSYQWKPESDNEKAVTARYILLNKVCITHEWRLLLGPWLIIAEQATLET